MKLKNTDINRISKRKCQTKGCPNKASGILKKKFKCRECYRKEHPTKIDRRLYYINYGRLY